MTPDALIVIAAIVLFGVVISRPRHRHRRQSWFYRAYMRSHVWKFRRWLWYWTSNRRCECCGCPLSLHRKGLRWRLGAAVMTVHHKTYRHLGRERRSEVTLACWDCHKKLDGWRYR